MSCLFNSMSYFLKYTPDEIRQKICDYLESNKPIIEGLDTKFILDLDEPNYVRNMRNRNQWGGGIEIQAACNLWNLRIIIHNIRDKTTLIEFIPLTNKFMYTIELTWNGSHFEPKTVR